jgi:hypothetical protein
LNRPKPKVKLVTPVWGFEYIEMYCDISLPSFLGPGNIEALLDKEVFDFEFVILTVKTSVGLFDGFPAFQKLRQLCEPKFIEIDDLITSDSHLYGITLTLAYQRAMSSCGEDMKNTYFMLMNADFILANGALKTLARLILKGEELILVSSIRSVSEDVEPLLKERMKTGLALDLEPRDLVRIALQHPQRTHVAKLKNQTVTHTSHPNQFFWKHDEHTWLGRVFLMWIMCIKPGCFKQGINSFSDYGFIPELCPSVKEHILDDSDDFFMLELQNRESEAHLIQLGAYHTPSAVRSLSSWTTTEHRRVAQHDLLFHSEGIPGSIGTTRQAAKSFIDEILAQLGPVLCHDSHTVWQMGVERWMAARLLPDPPAELEPVPKKQESAFQRSLARFRTMLQYSGCYFTLDFMRKAVRGFVNQGDEVLVAGDHNPLFKMVLAEAVDGLGATLQTVIPGTKKTPANAARPPRPEAVYQPPRKALVFCEKTDRESVRRLLAAVETGLAAGAKLLIVVHPKTQMTSTDFVVEIADFLSARSPNADVRVTSVGGRSTWRCRSIGQYVSNRIPNGRVRLKHLFGVFSLMYLVVQNVVTWMSKKRRKEHGTLLMTHALGVIRIDEKEVQATRQ